ncbi:MAG: TetR/AcrR family transcriptional regulator [Solirubrobacterales bacterium]
MPSNRTRAKLPPAATARGGATRERLLRAAVELLEEGGYAAASVAAIAERSDVAAGALYRHFPSKAELFVEVFRTAAEQELAALYEASAGTGSVAEKLDAVVREFTNSALSKPRLAWALGYEPVDPLVDAERLAYRQTYRERLADLLRIGIASGELPAQDVDLTAASLMGAIGEALVSPLSPVGEGVRAEELVSSLSRFCQRAVGLARE